MRYLSVCSGIEAASVAWRELNWSAVGFAEIDNFPAAVLAHHFPNVPNFGDLLDYEKWPIEPGAIDVICGGPPCQSFSVAGKRGGMEDERGDLARTFFLLARRLRPEWLVFENVPGILSSAGGADFRSLLQTLTESGYGYAYRILDAQHFGVAQRRRRLYLVANATDWRRAAAVLFEPESLRGDSAPRRAKGQGATAGPRRSVEIVGTLCADSHPGSYSGQDAYTGRLIPAPAPIPIQDGRGLNKGQNGLGIGGEGDPSYTLDTMGAASVAAPAPAPVVARGPHAVAFRDPSPTLTAKMQGASGWAPYNEDAHLVGVPLDTTGAAAVAAPFAKSRRAKSVEDFETWKEGLVAPTLSTFDNTGDTRATVAIVTPPPAYAVRRLTPTECERLQGFPDDWTAVPYRGKPASDGPRYKAIGNSMAVPVMRWIGERIDILQRSIERPATQEPK